MTSTAAPQEPEGPEPPERPGRPGPEEPGPSGTPSTQAPAGWCGQYPTAGLGKALAGNLTFLNPRFLDDADCVAALESLALLKAWTDAQTARTIYRLRDINHTHLTGPGAYPTHTRNHQLDQPNRQNLPNHTRAPTLLNAHLTTPNFYAF